MDLHTFKFNTHNSGPNLILLSVCFLFWFAITLLSFFQSVINLIRMFYKHGTKQQLSGTLCATAPPPFPDRDQYISACYKQKNTDMLTSSERAEKEGFWNQDMVTLVSVIRRHAWNKLWKQQFRKKAPKVHSFLKYILI